MGQATETIMGRERRKKKSRCGVERWALPKRYASIDLECSYFCLRCTSETLAAEFQNRKAPKRGMDQRERNPVE